MSTRQSDLASFFSNKRKREEDLLPKTQPKQRKIVEDVEEDEVEETEDHDDIYGEKKRRNDHSDSDSENEDELEEEKVVRKQTSSRATLSTLGKKGAVQYEYGNYDPVQKATWKKDQPAPFLFLAKTFDQIENTSSRIKITELLCNCFRSLIVMSPSDLLPAVYLCTKKLAAAHEGIELGVGDGLLVKALAEATGKNAKQVKKMYSDEGDLGIVANNARSNQKTMFTPKPLTISGVYKDFKVIATSTGKNSQQKKTEKIKLLLVSSKDTEPKYIIRSLQGKLRIGLGEETVLVAIAHAIVLTGVGTTSNSSSRHSTEDLKQAEEILKMVYSEMPCYDRILGELLQNGFKNLDSVCKLTPGIPVRPMLAKASKEVNELFERFGKNTFTCEYKYDGERQQIHILEDGTIKLYSRNLEDTTSKFPDLIAMLPNAMQANTKSAILDCEVVAYDKEEMKIKPFQILSTRGRKNITIADIKVPVCLFAFDILYLNGESLLKKNLKERREALYSSFTRIRDQFDFAVHSESSDPEEIQEFLAESVKGNCEGLIVKSLEHDASYEPSRRSFNWLKLKKDYIKGLGDSLDLVPIGGYKGKGKRTGTYGGFLLACFDSDTETFQSICKIGTGFSDEILKQFTNDLDKYVIDKPKSYYSYASVHEPDVWFDAKVVWEVLTADLTLSPTHTAAIGLVDDSRGVALRFPRFVRVRTDKQPEEATSSEQVADFYRKQASVH